MEPVITHLREYQSAYIAGAVCLLPIIFLTRRYSVPLILYTVEIAIYLSLMHLGIWLLVNLTRWFKEQSSMRALQSDGRPVDAPDWQTPLLTFWDRELYQPGWLVWVELVGVAIIVVLVIRYRPLKLQRKRAWHFTDKSEKKKASRPGAGARTAVSARSGGRGGRR